MGVTFNDTSLSNEALTGFVGVGLKHVVQRIFPIRINVRLPYGHCWDVGVGEDFVSPLFIAVGVGEAFVSPLFIAVGVGEDFVSPLFIAVGVGEAFVSPLFIAVGVGVDLTISFLIVGVRVALATSFFTAVGVGVWGMDLQQFPFPG